MSSARSASGLRHPLAERADYIGAAVPGSRCPMPYRKLAGLRVLVTGASQGIGRALCVAAAGRGCRVLAAARSQPLLDELAAEVRAARGTIETVAADVTKPEDRQAMVDAAVR